MLLANCHLKTIPKFTVDLNTTGFSFCVGFFLGASFAYVLPFYGAFFFFR